MSASGRIELLGVSSSNGRNGWFSAGPLSAPVVLKIGYSVDGRGWPKPARILSCGGASGPEGDSVDLDLRVQQQAGDLHGGAGGRVFRKELSADA